MDPPSHRVANALAGNPPDAATLEATLVGPEVQFADERVVAVAGAEFELWLDGGQVSSGSSLQVDAGSRLRFGRRVRGSRAYLAIAGGIAVPPELGSRATHLVSGMGGLAGRALVGGDRLPLGEARIRLKPNPTGDADPTEAATSVIVGSGFSRIASATVRSGARIAKNPITIPDGHARVRVLPGPQDEWFEADALTLLQAAPYTIASESDRMGFRLEGPTLTTETGRRNHLRRHAARRLAGRRHRDSRCC